MCCHTYSHLFGECGDEGMTLLNSCVKELALFENMWQTTHLIWVDQLNRFLALHALVEGLVVCWAVFGLRGPILLNWVRFRPGIWDGGAISSTGCGAVCDRAPSRAPIRGSKLGWTFYQYFWLRLGSNLLMWIASLASLVIWEGSLSTMLKLLMDGNGWWKSLQCLSMAKVVDLECSLTLSPRVLEVSPM